MSTKDGLAQAQALLARDTWNESALRELAELVQQRPAGLRDDQIAVLGDLCTAIAGWLDSLGLAREALAVQTRPRMPA